MMPPNPYEGRTTQKLEFAKLYLVERLKCLGDGSTPERAHEESFLYHLIGAKDSFLQEINHALNLGVPEDKVREDRLRAALQKRQLTCVALDEIERLSKEEWNWLSLAIWFRHHSAHRKHITRAFSMATGDLQGGSSNTVAFYYPKSKNVMEQDVPAFLGECMTQMAELIIRLRSTLPRS